MAASRNWKSLVPEIEQELDGLPRYIPIIVVATEVLAVSERQVRRYIKKGRLQAQKLHPDRNGQVRVSKASLQKFLLLTRVSPGGQPGDIPASRGRNGCFESS